ncbi:MAG: bifunctional alpha,alpha-trehalose-phosphate synthase (UDP-forming)/trehalose-phosphatase [Cyclobacteriaceae bacterium]
MPKTIIVSNRLPLKVQVENKKMHFAPSEGGLATGLGSIYKDGENLWVGWPGVAVKKDEKKKEVTARLKKDSMRPVFLTDQEIEEYYEGFSNETLWPNFHYFNQYVVYEDRFWEAYQKVNAKFAKEVCEVAEPGDTIWIQDYQLLLLPQLIRKALVDSNIGFFLHIPFPSYESFRILPWRRELLLGMLGADFLGFHTYDDMRHFLSSVNRLAGYGNAQGIVNVQGRKVLADALPMGIDYDRYAETAAAPETLEREVRYRTSIRSEKLMLSIDRLDYSKGIPQRLMAFELFLNEYPEFLGKVSLLMIVVPSRDQVGKYKELKEEVDLLVGRINGQLGRLNWTPIHYFYRSFPLNALSAFYRMSHVALVTPMRDGMNLVCKEYIASRLDQKGVLILSEMAGSSKELSDAILINPNNIGQMVQAIKTALTMPEKQQIRHMEVMQRSLKRYNIHHWVDLFMQRLKFIKKEQQSLITKILDKPTTSDILQSYSTSKDRIIFLDYDGTLVDFHSDPNQAKPDKELKDIIKGLTSKKENRIVIISGRDKEILAKWFGGHDVDIIAEHGVWLREQGKNWETVTSLSNDWMKDIKEVLEGYVNRTPGSFVETKDYSLVWHYRKVETGLGELRTRELNSHLNYLATNKNLHVLEGDKVVEIKNSEVHKGRAAETWLNKFQPEFTMAIGDDWTDEDTFRAMPKNSVTIKVGSNQSEAKYSVRSSQEVRKLLQELLNY